MIDLSTLEPERVRPLRRAEYDRLVELGYFEDEKIELLEGVLVAMSPQGTEHTHVVSKLTMLFARAIGERALLRVQGPFAASDSSEPEPDLALVPNLDYSREHAARAFLVIEVAESSLRKDRLLKANLYARAEIPEYWIVNLRDRAIEVHRTIRNGSYAQVDSHGADETISPSAFPDIAVRIADVLPTLAL
jgi:Uma2 family endonuclease